MSDAPRRPDDDGYLGALDFGDEFGADDREQSAIDALDTDEPTELPETATTHAIEILSEDTDHATAPSDPSDAAGLVAVTNPAETVTVWAMPGGEIHRIDLAPEAVSMTAPGLANEILAIAQLAQERGKSELYSLMLGTFNERGAADDETLGEFLTDGIGLPSPEQAARSQAAVFAARYGE